MKPKVLVIGSGHTPTGRCRALLNQMLFVGVAASYHNIDDEIVGKEVHQALVDDHAFKLVNMDFSELELRFGNALIYGHSHPEMFQFDDLPIEPSPDKRKGPKGPRGKWGKLK